ncbi:MAG: radical SAM protein [Egibacteraceae bacterium]
MTNISVSVTTNATVTGPIGSRLYHVVDGKIQTEACEISIAEHCNLRCRGCSHLSPVLPADLADPDVIYRDLAVLARHYHAEHLRILGGEPLLHPRILEVVAAVRASGVTDRIRILTNGMLMERMSERFWQAVDEIHVSVYPGFEPSQEALTAWRDRAQEHTTEVIVKRFGWFRESYSEAGTQNPELVSRIYSTCQIAHVWRCHNVSNGRFYKCPQSVFLSRLRRGRTTDVAHSNGVALVDHPSLGQSLLDYLQDPRPLPACGNCLGSVGRRFEHEQVSRKDWRRHQAAGTEDLLDHQYLRLLERDAGAANGCVADSHRL